MTRSLAQSQSTAQGIPRPKTLASYVQPLSVPPVLRPTAGQTLTIPMGEFKQKVHRDLPPTRFWGYNGAWPGPTLDVKRDTPFAVNWVNELPRKHFLPIDPTIHGCEEGTPEVRTSVHVHGAHVLPESDGYPDSWITPDGKTGPMFFPGPARYTNGQPATTLWYHDHAMGITRLNIHAGLAGFFLIRDEIEIALNLPCGKFEIPLMIQDHSFLADGSLYYPPAQNGTHPMWMQEFFGENICVNGRVAPYLEVEPRKYRFRIVNGSNARFYKLTMVPSSAAGKAQGQPVDAPPFHQIGSDCGLLPAPLTSHFLLIAPGERFDVIIDFSGHKGANFTVINDAPSPYPRGGEGLASDVMLFRVNQPLSGKDSSDLPNALVPWIPLNPAEAARERILSITEMDRPSDGYTMMGMLGGKHWTDPITEDPKAGSMEIWSFANATGDVHPIHTHMVRFQVINRQTFDAQVYQQSGKIVYTGRPIAPEFNERPAWKDTVKTYPGYITRVIQRFDLPAGTPIAPGQEFLYVWHCHVLEHEDNEMMRPYKIVG
ncbi:MAG: multicopper oxidase domain-containing protein [Acidobacteria bacterium]|nr:multicopper oxidase domain-containing protein [Acidobacteriota bacterium]